MAWSDLSMEQIHVHQSSWMMLMATLQRRLIQAFLLGINKIKAFFAGSMPHYQKGCWHMLWDWLLLEVPSKGGLHLYPNPISSNWKPNSNIKKGPQSIIEYVQKIKTISDSLAAVSCPVDEEDLIIHTLNGLPPEYGAFKTAIRTHSSPISIEELHVLLLREEMNLDGSQQGIPDFSTTAPLTSKDTVKLGNFNNNRGRGNCARGRGRFNSNRGQGNSYSQRSNSHSQNSRSCCQICNRTGHTALDYFHRMDCCFQEKHPPSQLAAMATSYHPAAEQTMVCRCRFRGYKPHHPWSQQSLDSFGLHHLLCNSIIILSLLLMLLASPYRIEHQGRFFSAVRVGMVYTLSTVLLHLPLLLVQQSFWVKKFQLELNTRPWGANSGLVPLTHTLVGINTYYLSEFFYLLSPSK